MSFAYSYAQALNQASTEQDFPAVVEKLNTLNQVFERETKLNMFFLSPAIPVEAKKQALKKVFESLNYKGLVCSFLYLLLDKKKWEDLPAIMKHLNNMKETSQGVLPAEVESAFPLSQDLKEKLAQKLKLFFGQPVLLNEKIKPQLTGGIRVRAKGFVFDDSLSSHLKKLEKSA